MSEFMRYIFQLLIAGSLLLMTGCFESERLVDKAARNKIFHMGNGSDPATFDPQLVNNSVDSNIAYALFEGLVSADPETVKPIPGIATSWDISEDGLVYTFNLRRNATWSDGKIITAEDFLRSWQRVLTPSLASSYANFFFPIENAEAFYKGEIKDFERVGIKALDDFTLELRLSTSVPYFIDTLYYPVFFPVPTYQIEKFSPVTSRDETWTKAKNIVSNGPFVLEEWVPNKWVRLKKNPKYWDKDAVGLSEIYLYPISQALIEERLFKAGQLHKVNSVASIKMPFYLEERPTSFYYGPMYATFYLMLNTEKKPFSDVNVRRALGMAIDRDSIVKNILKAGQQSAGSLVPPDSSAYRSSLKMSFNPEEARRLLAEAGFPEGKNFPSVTLLYNISDDREKISTALQQMWKKHLGINVKLASQEWKVFLVSQDNMQYDVSVRAWKGDYIDPTTFLDLYRSNSLNNGTGWTDNRYDTLLDKAIQEKDEPSRFKLMAEAEDLLINDAPILPMYFFTRGVLVDPRITGFYSTPDDYISFKHLAFKEDK
jgi:oligopeptide transport system substrate-binding protein